MNLQTNQKGFTIVELLIVIVVIAILAAISIVAYTGVQENARKTQRAADAKVVADAINAYYAEEGSWPSTSGTLADCRTDTLSALAGFNTVRVSDTATNKIHVDPPDTSNRDRIHLICSATGTQVQYWGDGAVASYQTGS